MKVMTIVGTRPELIRLSRVLHRLDTTDGVEHVLVHTGQNYDYQLNNVFFDDLQLRSPDHMLDVDTTSLGKMLGGTLIAAEKVMLQEQPDAVLILGDTNSSIAGLMARRLKIPLYHMEAGNRCFDLNVPEETNRRLVDHISDFNLPYTEHARHNLLSEGLHPRRIMKTGSPMNEVLMHYRRHIDASDVVDRLGLQPGQYFVVSAHREENVDSPERLTMLLDCMKALHREYQIPIHVSTHPRTRKQLTPLLRGSSLPGITFGEPLGFHDYNKLQLESFCVLSDSGTIAEESSLLDFPAITLRDSIERPEALDAGTLVMTGLSSEEVLAGVAYTRASRTSSSNSRKTPLPDDYTIQDTSHRVVNFILSTYRKHHSWAGIRIAPSAIE